MSFHDERLQNIRFDPICTKDVAVLGNIHLLELETSVITLFGSDFLSDWYEALIEKGNWGIVAKYEHQVIGFIFATQIQTSLIKCLKLKSLLYFVVNSIFNPKKLSHFLFVFLKIVCTKKGKFYSIAPPTVEITSFAVNKDWAGHGVGRLLLQRFEDEARRRNFSSIITSTHNERLCRFYQKEKFAAILDESNFGSYKSIVLAWDV